MLKRILFNRNRYYIVISQIINALVALSIGKLIATYISPEDFGLYNLQFAAYFFIVAMIIKPFMQYVKATTTTLLPRLGTKLYLQTFIPILFLAGISVLLYFYYYLGVINNITISIIIIFIVLNTLFNVISDNFNINNEIKRFSILHICKGLIGLVFIATYLVFDLSFISKIESLWLMQLIGVSFGVILYFKHYKIYYKRFSVKYISFIINYLKFAWPIVILAFWVWLNNYFDRYAIEHFMSLNAVGVYNANYGLGSKFFLMASPIFTVLLTPKVYAYIKLKEKKKVIEKYVQLYSIFGLLVLFFIYFLRNQIGLLLLSQLYEDGFYLIFWIALAFFMLTLSYFYENFFYSENRTNYILYSNMFSAIVNVSLNIFLIPIFGITGAASATVIAFGIKLVITIFLFKKT